MDLITQYDSSSDLSSSTTSSEDEDEQPISETRAKQGPRNAQMEDSLANINVEETECDQNQLSSCKGKVQSSNYQLTEQDFDDVQVKQEILQELTIFKAEEPSAYIADAFEVKLEEVENTSKVHITEQSCPDQAQELSVIEGSSAELPQTKIWDFKDIQIKKEQNSEDSSVSSSDSESDLVSLDSSEISENDDEKTKAKKRKPPKSKNELEWKDLPPIQDLHISVPHSECQPIGKIQSIVEPLVVVEGFKLSSALDIDSVLFLSQGDVALGKIFDVFGPVTHPHYTVRFNSKDHIDSREVKVGDLVYCAPNTQHTSYVLVAQLRRMKGTDASWKDDLEKPLEEQDFSDDEAERAAKGIKHNSTRRKRTHSKRKFVPSNVPGFRPRTPNPSSFYNNSRQSSSFQQRARIMTPTFYNNAYYGQVQYHMHPNYYWNGPIANRGFAPPPPPPSSLQMTYSSAPTYYNKEQ